MATWVQASVLCKSSKFSEPLSIPPTPRHKARTQAGIAPLTLRRKMSVTSGFNTTKSAWLAFLHLGKPGLRSPEQEDRPAFSCPA